MSSIYYSSEIKRMKNIKITTDTIIGIHALLIHIDKACYEKPLVLLGNKKVSVQ